MGCEGEGWRGGGGGFFEKGSGIAEGWPRGGEVRGEEGGRRANGACATCDKASGPPPCGAHPKQPAPLH
eukprot:scaffold2380_cov102-Isochrysis_galbana.AAC.17